MRFASLGSGSEGNALLVEGSGPQPFRLLVDCGFALREVSQRMQRLGCDAAGLHAILVTHEHGDHAGGVFRLARAHDIPVYLTHGTWRSCPSAAGCEDLVRLIDSHAAFDLGGLRVQPFPVPHDASEPVQFVLDDGAARLGVLTDIGHPTAHLAGALGRPTALVLETNHDARMLAEGPYPAALKRRIGGRYGHLENGEAARILAAIDRSALRTVVAAHLSRQNNRADLARAALAPVLGWPEEAVTVAHQDDGCGWIDA